MVIPVFLLRKLYRRGSLRETADGRFAFTLRNRIGGATLVAPPRITVNGIAYGPEEIDAGDVDLAAISPRNPYRFERGAEVDLYFPGRLMRGGNRIHFLVQTEEFGELDFLVDDREADFCDVSAALEEE